MQGEGPKLLLSCGAQCLSCHALWTANVARARLQLIRALARLRHEDSIFTGGAQEWIAAGEGQGTVAFLRRLNERAVFVSANLNGMPSEFTVGVAAKGASPILFEGESLGVDGTCRLNPYGFVVVECADVS